MRKSAITRGALYRIQFNERSVNAPRCAKQIKLVFTFAKFEGVTTRIIMYRALYDFKSNGPGVLSFKKDEVFHVSEKIDGDWLMGKNDSGDTGLLPASYLEKKETRVYN